MDIVKGLSRLQSNLEMLIAEAEAIGTSHLKLLKSIHHKLDTYVRDPLLVEPEQLETMSLELALRDAEQDDLPAERYDLFVLSLRLIATSRRRELDQAYGPDDDIPAIEKDSPSISSDSQEYQVAVGFY